MQGFFSKTETSSAGMYKGKPLSCTACGLLSSGGGKFTAVEGVGKLKILNIFENPSNREVSINNPFKGTEFLQAKTLLLQSGINILNDCWNIYAVGCAEKDVNDLHVTNCRRFVDTHIKKLKPDLIFCWGNTATRSIIGHRWKKDFDNIDKWRGWQIPDQELKCWIAPLFSAMSCSLNILGVEALLTTQDINKALSKLKEPFPIQEAPDITYLGEDLSILEKLRGNVCIDFETTGLKPHAEGHAIICASVAISGSKAYVFEVTEDKKRMRPFLRLLKSNNGKIAHNMKFEDTWATVYLGCTPNRWIFDTQIAAHIIDNRPSVTSLKFQTYVQLGIIDYDSEVSPYLKSAGNNGNEFNQIKKAVADGLLPKIMKYCAEDTLYTYRLAEKWMPCIFARVVNGISPAPDIIRAYRLFHEGNLSLARAERNGMRVDTNYLKNRTMRITHRIKQIETEFYASDFFKEWRRTSPSGHVNITSGDQLAKYLYGTKGLKAVSTTDKGKGSTDAEALSALKIPEIDLLIERNKLLKLRDTYLGGYLKEQVDGFIHPFFNLNSVKTYRSSSNSPNFQNVPKRDKVAMKTVRDSMFPREGHMLLELDFSGVEVAIAACYHKDPVMISYLLDKSTDMHGDMAAKIFGIEKFNKHAKSHSLLRSATKNSFVFPQFYGDYYGNCAINICMNWVQLPQTKWKGTEGIVLEDGTPLSRHLMSQGIKSFEQFTQHMKEIEDFFWNSRFKVYAEWKKLHYKEYLRKGYVTLKTGFACTMPMYKNDAINYPVQGAAFHCLLWTFIEVDKELCRLGYSSRLIGQIHDAVVIDAHPDEVEDVYAIVQRIGTEELPKAFPWINVPLKLEAELCPVDSSWSHKQEWDGLLKNLK